MQSCTGLQIRGLEEALYTSQALRSFVGIDLNRDPIADATMMVHFGHQLEGNDFIKGPSDEVCAMPAERSLVIRQSLPGESQGNDC